MLHSTLSPYDTNLLLEGSTLPAFLELQRIKMQRHMLHSFFFFFLQLGASATPQHYCETASSTLNPQRDSGHFRGLCTSSPPVTHQSTGQGKHHVIWHVFYMIGLYWEFKVMFFPYSSLDFPVFTHNTEMLHKTQLKKKFHYTLCKKSTLSKMHEETPYCLWPFAMFQSIESVKSYIVCMCGTTNIFFSLLACQKACFHARK